MEKLNDFLTIAQLIWGRDGLGCQDLGCNLLLYIIPLPYINQKKIVLIIDMHIFEIKQKQKPFPPTRKTLEFKF